MTTYPRRIIVASNEDGILTIEDTYDSVKEAVAALGSGQFKDGTYEVLTRARHPITIRTRTETKVEFEGGEPTIRRGRTTTGG